jgi:ferredoxin
MSNLHSDLHAELRVDLHIDWTRCDGHGLCHALLPGRINLDEWGFPVIAETVVDADDEFDVRRAVAACPALALRVERQLVER